MSKPKILIVEDDDALRLTLKEIIGLAFECVIIEAVDGRQAVEFLKNDKFDLMLLDIKMPGISGVDIIKKKKELYSNTDILVVSAWDSQAIAAEVLEDGAFDYIPKPSNFNVILEKISEILKKRGKYLPI
ncbi:MAG: response regulator [Candidatus Omnitrophica bacterium]|nr:response regulator [Candidatus Omnitrophota bacterium]